MSQDFRSKRALLTQKQRKQNIQQALEYNDESQVTQVQNFLNTISDSTVDASLEQNEVFLQNQLKKQDQKEQQIVVKNAAQSLQEVNKKLEEITKETPQKVLENVKQQQKQVQKEKQQQKQELKAPQIPRGYINVRGQLVSRPFFKNKLIQMSAQYPYPDKVSQLLSKYGNTRKGNRLLPLSQMQINGSLFFDKLQAYDQGRKSVQSLIDRLETEVKYIDEKPKNWYRWYLRKRGITDRIAISRAANSDETVQQQAKTRKDQLKAKLKTISQQLDKYVLRANKKRKDNLRQYTKIIQAKNQLHTTQKNVLTYLIDTKTTQISDLNKKIVQQEAGFQKFKQQTDQQTKKIKEENQAEQQRLLKEIDALEKQVITEKKQLTEARQRSRQQISELRKEAENMIFSMQNQKQIIVTQAQQVINSQRQKAQLIQKNLQKQIQVQKHKDQELEKKNRQLLQKQQVQMLLIKKQNEMIKALQAKNQLLQSRQQALTLQIQNKKIIETKRQQLDSLKIQNQKRIMELVEGVEQKSKQLTAFKTESTTTITKLTKQIKEHQDELKRVNEAYSQEITKLKAQMLNIKGYNDGILKTSAQEKRKMQNQYSKLKSVLGSRQSDYQNHVKALTSTIQKEKAQKQLLLENLGAKTKQNEELFSRYSSQIQSLTRKSSEALLASQTLQKRNAAGHLKELTEEKTKNMKLMQRMNEQNKIFQDKFNAQNSVLEKLEKEKKALEAKATSLNSELQKTLKKLKEQIEKAVLQTQFKYWKKGRQFTIRQCFRHNKDSKWIASTRGINFTENQKPAVQKAIDSWLNQQGSPQPLKRKLVPGSKIIEIIDEYKGKYYYSLRQGYYYSGVLEPTRRGFNISEADLISFAKGVSSIQNSQNIQD